MFYHYLKEIRNRSFLILIAWSSSILICYFYKEILLFFLVKPVIKPSKITVIYFIYTNLFELFSTYVFLSFFWGNLVFISLFLYNLLNFLTPGLFYEEICKFRAMGFICLISIILSFMVLNNILLPIISEFFLLLHEAATAKQLSFHLEAKIYDYLCVYVLMYFSLLVSLLLFILFSYLLEIRGKTIVMLKRFRKIFYFGIIVLATFLTPPDIFCQCLFSLVLVGVTEILLLFSIFRSSLVNHSSALYKSIHDKK